MKKNLFHIFCLGILCLATATIGIAQEDRTLSSAAGDLYVISAKAGGVNYVEGRVSVQRSNGTSGYLIKGDTLESGDKVSTSASSRAEVLMNPGSFVRLNQNSEFEFVTTSLDDLKLQVNRGSAIFEVFASDDFKVTVNTPTAKFYLVNTGVYRVDVLDNGVGKLEVHSGKAQIGSLSAEKIGKGKSATVNGSDVSIAKFDRGDTDNFEDWSKSRAKMIAKANKKLSQDKLANSILSRNYSSSCYNSFGLWVYNPRYSSYSFLPFGYGWRSPYGYSFGLNSGICDLPYYYPRYRRYYPGRRGGNNGGNGGGNGGGTSTTTVPAANVERGNRTQTPIFRRMENSGNGNRPKSARRSSFPTYGSPRTTRSTRSTRTTRSTRSTKTTRSTSPPRSSKSAPLSKPKGKN